MKASVFLDAFAECLAGVGMARRTPSMRYIFREMTIHNVVARNGVPHADPTGRMFDKLWSDLQTPEPKQ